jgi:hypothetical protein
MTSPSLYELLLKMDAQDILLAYKGEINSQLLDAVYSMMNKNFEQSNAPAEIRKKFFHVLVESLQNLFHHQIDVSDKINKENNTITGFLITGNGSQYRIVTGNYITKDSIVNLKQKLDEVNGMNSQDLREYYKQSLASGEYSEKGGAGLGIIEMARKSGNKLTYEFTDVNSDYSFFSLSVTVS